MSTAAPESTLEQTAREAQALSCISSYAWGNAFCSLIPLPIFDLVALTGVQLAMVGKLAKIYDVPFQKDAVKSIIISLIGSLSSMTLATGVVLSVMKFIPVIGVQAAVVTLPAVAGATTYAVGKIFIMHFEAGGNVLDFNADAMKVYFQQYYQEGLKAGKK